MSLALLLVLFIAYNANAQDTDTNEWQYDLTLYGWFVDIGGTVNGPGSSFDMDISEIIDDLSFTFMGGFEARKNRWSIIADAIFLDVGNDKNTFAYSGTGKPINASVGLDIATWILTGEVGYDVVQTDRIVIAVVGGVRYAWADVDVSMNLLGLSTERSESEGVLDGVVGVRGLITLNEQWYLPYYANIGTGDSDLTWQALAGIGY